MKDGLRQSVLEVSRALFLKKGFDAVGMRDIAHALGLQPTQVYRMELSKADILAEVIIELNAELIDTLPVLLQEINSGPAVQRTCDYLLALYQFDIHYQPLRSVGAIHGWSWSGACEAAVIAQVWQFLAPIAQWLQQEGYDAIPARCYAIWSLYYVGYRRAVTQGGTAEECLEEIRPSLQLLFKP